MNLGSAIATNRKQGGLSQERLAEAVGVSRQAVTKWESGEAAPDIDNLVALAAFFGVTVDSLLRTPGCHAGGDPRRDDSASIDRPRRPGHPRIGEDPDFLAFLCRAKRATYAGHGSESPSSRTASHDLAHAEGGYAYYDTYLGGERFIGEEAVWRDGVPLWAMNYSGRVIVGELFFPDFLKEALSSVTEDLPFRGPSVLEKGEFAYHCMVSGDTEWFTGSEEILTRGVKVYECVYHGGLIR